MTQPEPLRLLRLPDVLARTGMRRTALLALVRTNRFPQPVHLTGRTVAWKSHEIDAWIAARPVAIRGAVPEQQQIA
jgi:prophage regulatory protein